MTSLLQAMAIFAPGVVRVGPMRLSVYGIFAAAGLIAAIWLSQRTAVLAGLSADKVWDAGMFAVTAAFVASRVLLVLMDLKSFLRYPLLVLSLPSLTYGGMVLTALLVWLYLRWKRLPLLRVLDAWAPCAALLAAVLSLAHFVEGTNAGMPTRLPWGVVTSGDSVLGRVHPVQLYATVMALAFGVLLLAMLRREALPGRVAAAALVAGGMASFLLDMLTQPVESYGYAWLDPGQFVALALMAAGAWIATKPGKPRNLAG